MKTVGEILQRARNIKKLTLEEISQRTRIGINYLAALERNEFKKLPPAAFTKGFIRNYSQVIDLDPDQVLAIFRRDYDQDSKGHIVPRLLNTPSKNKFNFFTPNTTAIVTSGVIALIIIAFFARQVIIYLSAPPLTLTSPPDQAQVASPVMVTGHTHPDAALTINNKPIKLLENGDFSVPVELTPGNHTLVVVSTSRSKKTRSQQRYITVTSPNP